MTMPFEVVPATVTDAGRFAQDTATALRHGIRAMDTEIAALMTTWKGDAADAYLAGWHGALAVFDAVTGMADALGVTAADFADLDARRAAATTRITSSLNL
jgi:uncharacterized protein YukE